MSKSITTSGDIADKLLENFTGTLVALNNESQPKFG